MHAVLNIISAISSQFCAELAGNADVHYYVLHIHTLVQLNLGEISAAVLVMHCLPQILPIFSLHATVPQDGVWVSSFSPHATSTLCFGLPHDQLTYQLWGIAAYACTITDKL